MHDSGVAQPATGALLKDSPWTISRRVIGALLIRELLTRYGRNNIGFLWLFVEPMLFTLVVAAVWSATRTIHGSNIPIIAFALTGYSSLLMWRNMASRCIGAIHANRTLLYHRQVRIIDVYAARLLLEIFAISGSLVVLTMVFYAVDKLKLPEDPLQVIGGWALLAWFSAALGLTIGGLSEKFDIVAKLWPPIQYTLLPFSGVAYIVDALPSGMQKIVVWLPMLNALECVREGWFGSAMHGHYDVMYLITFNLGLTFFGLILVRQVGMGTDASEE
jgi:ABC-2 type transport system permease protein/capsular polysaccharide transport system permease protein